METEEIVETPKRSVPLRIAKRIKKYVTISLIAVTLVAYSAVFISPDVLQFPQFVGMGYPYLLVVDILYIIVLVIFKQKDAIFLGAVVALGFGFIRNTVQINPIPYFSSSSRRS